MKKLIFVFIPIVNTLMAYLFGTFVSLNPNVFTWDVEGRAVLGIIAIVSIVMSPIAYMAERDISRFR